MIFEQAKRRVSFLVLASFFFVRVIAACSCVFRSGFIFPVVFVFACSLVCPGAVLRFLSGSRFHRVPGGFVPVLLSRAVFAYFVPQVRFAAVLVLVFFYILARGRGDFVFFEYGNVCCGVGRNRKK